MNKPLLDLYADYLISSFGPTTATGLSRLLEANLSHDKITRFLSGQEMTSKHLWQLVKPLVRQVETEDGVLIVDDSIISKPYTDENDLVCWHYDHTQGKSIKGINFLTSLYFSNDVSLPVSFALVTKTEESIDQKTGKTKLKSKVTKNEHYKMMLKACVHNQLKFRYVLNDVWFASADNMKFVKNDLNKEFVMPLKTNRKVALSEQDKKEGRYQAVDSVSLEPGGVQEIWLEQMDFPLLLVKQVFENKDQSQNALYLVTSDLTLSNGQIIDLYQKRWQVEEYHKSLKQNAALAASPTRTVRTQSNHFFCALCAYVKLETLKMKTALNHFALKNKLYITAIRNAWSVLQNWQPESLLA